MAHTLYQTSDVTWLACEVLDGVKGVQNRGTDELIILMAPAGSPPVLADKAQGIMLAPGVQLTLSPSVTTETIFLIGDEGNVSLAVWS